MSLIKLTTKNPNLESKEVREYLDKCEKLIEAELTPLTEEEYDIMNTGTTARRTGDFGSWTEEDRDQYWAIVAKFDEWFKLYWEKIDGKR